MRLSADPGAGPVVLADGIARYVELFRAQPAAPDIETMRLLGDLTAHRFAQSHSPDLRRYDTCIAAPGREIAVRVFDPGGAMPRPAICYFHGGGFAFGSVESFDIACAALAEATGAVVVSVQYRRLPEADYPAAQDDCDRAFAWIARRAGELGIDPARIAVAGDSAGALLALHCAANARDAGGPVPVCQLLFYGTFAMDPERPDYAASQDPLLTGERVRGYIALYRRCGGRSAPIDRDDLSDLAPTVIVAAEHDPLRGEAEALGARLGAAVRVAPGMIHGFLRAVGVSADARSEVARAAAAVRPFLEGTTQ